MRLRYSFKSIKKIDENRLVYVDEFGKVEEILFSQCRTNWVKHIKNKRSQSNDNKQKKILTEDDTSCVGIRKIDADKPFFEFCSHNIVRFEFEPTNGDELNEYETFDSIRDRINEVGWTTFDLS